MRNKSLVAELQAESTRRLAELTTYERALETLLQYDPVSQPGAFSWALENANAALIRGREIRAQGLEYQRHAALDEAAALAEKPPFSGTGLSREILALKRRVK